MKKFILAFVILDNYLTNLFKKMFRSRHLRTGHCRQCGNCCREIYLTMTPAQIKSRFFTKLAVRWISWLFDFILLRTDYENKSLVFTCRHLTPAGKCGNYFWRPNICRNYPLVDYFEAPKFLPACGYSAAIRGKPAR